MLLLLIHLNGKRRGVTSDIAASLSHSSARKPPHCEPKPGRTGGRPRLRWSVLEQEWGQRLSRRRAPSTTTNGLNSERRERAGQTYISSGSGMD